MEKPIDEGAKPGDLGGLDRAKEPKDSGARPTGGAFCGVGGWTKEPKVMGANPGEEGGRANEPKGFEGGKAGDGGGLALE